MPDPLAYALLIVAAIAYLGGAVLVVAALAKQKFTQMQRTATNLGMPIFPRRPDSTR